MKCKVLNEFGKKYLAPGPNKETIHKNDRKQQVNYMVKNSVNDVLKEN